MNPAHDHLWRPPLALLLALLGACSSDAPPRRPNVVVLVSDTTRADHLGFLGHDRPTSPRLDRLAEQSVVLRNHYGHASRTGPSTASLLTGLHPRSHGVVNPLDQWDAKGTLGEEQTTLAEMFANAGYATFGAVANVNVSPRFGFGQGYEEYTHVKIPDARVMNHKFVFPWLRGRQDDQRPFFLYVHYMDPHSPYKAPAPMDTAFVDGEYGGDIRGGQWQLDEVLKGERSLDDGDVEHLRALYDQEIAYLDAQVGELLDLLVEVGVDDDTILVFASDHGEEFLDHGSVFHGYTLYEEQLRVPMLIRAPGLAPRSVDGLTRHVDVASTVLELTGVAGPRDLQGTSLVPLLRGEVDALADDSVLAETSLRAIHVVKKRSLRAGGWKVIETELPEPRVELYDLTADPREQNDLADAAPEERERMRALLEAKLAALPEAEGATVELTESEQEELRRLGYLR